MKLHTFNRSRFVGLISFPALCELDKEIIESQSIPYPLTIGRYFGDSRGANLLTRLIIWKLRADGHYCYRNSSTGTPRKMKDGSVKWTPGGKHARGGGDVFSTIQGRSVFFEVKVGRDRISDAQLRFKAAIEKSGGLYLVCRTYDEFLTKYKTI